MADISDVENAIVNAITALVYPNGSSNPSVVLNDVGAAMGVRIYPGWPEPAALDADIQAGIMNISVFSRSLAGSNTTRFPPDYQTTSEPAPTVGASINASNQVIITGMGSAIVTQYVTVLVGSRVVFSYGVLPTDTASSIAAALAAGLTSSGAPATAVGAVISLNSGGAYMMVTIGVEAIQTAEWAREKVQEQITIWAPTPTSRSNAAKVIDPTLKTTTFLTTPDDFQTRFRYRTTVIMDSTEKVMFYRRDLIFECEYPTTLTDLAFQVTSIDDNIKGAQTDLGTAPRNDNFVPTAPQATPALIVPASGPSFVVPGPLGTGAGGGPTGV
jgi:hypothetical protein